MDYQESEQGSTAQSTGSNSAARESVSYAVPREGMPAQVDEGIDLIELSRIVWASKWVVASITALATSVAIGYAFLAPEWYRAEVLLVPVSDQTGQDIASQLSGLASLAGLSAEGAAVAEPIAVLQSRELAREFIEDLDLMTLLLADQWDPVEQVWKDDDPQKWPDIRDAVRFFDKYVRSVDQDPKTGLVTLAIEWTDPDLAAKWANLLVERLNDRMRSRALTDAEANVKYLRKELSNSSVVTLQQSISHLLEVEMQKLMLARGNKEFSFRVVDKAEVPKRRSKPKRVLIVILGTILGGIMAVLTVLVRQAFGR